MRISCLQLNTSDDLGANVARVESLVREAAHEGAQLVATPENTFLMQTPGTPLPDFTTETHPGIQAARNWAKELKIWLLIGSVAVLEKASQKHLNRSLLIDPDGNLAAHYDKIHLFDVEVGDGQSYRESAKFESGKKTVTAKLPDCTLGMTICYDVRFPHLYRSLAKAGAQILAVPSAFTQITGEAHWHVLLRARAIENGCFVIAPAQCGTHPGNRKTFGHSLIINPWGSILAERAEPTPGILLADIDVGEVDITRARIPSLKHDREFT